MMNPITRYRLKIDYEQLDHLKFWEGGRLLEEQKTYYKRKRHIHQAYTRVISTADWDDPGAPRYSLPLLARGLYS